VVNGLLTRPKERRSFKPKVASSILAGRIPLLPVAHARLDCMEIRLAEPDETEAIHELVDRAYGHYVERIGGRPGPMDTDYTEKVVQGHVSVAQDGGAIVGLIVLAREPDHLLVENVAVEPGRQGEGVGRALLAFAEDVARKASTPILRLYTHAKMTENLALYPRLGYEETHRRTDDGFERVFFAKHL
jgi:ribosomal protein S18 acetylase RimI-like enzyme